MFSACIIFREGFYKGIQKTIKHILSYIVVKLSQKMISCCVFMLPSPVLFYFYVYFGVMGVKITHMLYYTFVCLNFDNQATIVDNQA